MTQLFSERWCRWTSEPRYDVVVVFFVKHSPQSHVALFSGGRPIIQWSTHRPKVQGQWVGFMGLVRVRDKANAVIKRITKAASPQTTAAISAPGVLTNKRGCLEGLGAVGATRIHEWGLTCLLQSALFT